MALTSSGSDMAFCIKNTLDVGGAQKAMRLQIILENVTQRCLGLQMSELGVLHNENTYQLSCLDNTGCHQTRGRVLFSFSKSDN